MSEVAVEGARRGRKPGTKLAVFDCTPRESDSPEVKALKAKYQELHGTVSGARTKLAKIKSAINALQECVEVSAV